MSFVCAKQERTKTKGQDVNKDKETRDKKEKDSKIKTETQQERRHVWQTDMADGKRKHEISNVFYLFLYYREKIQVKRLIVTQLVHYEYYGGTTTAT